jgi:hypothetical protein
MLLLLKNIAFLVCPLSRKRERVGERAIQLVDFTGILVTA